ncbi:hypothetical protein GOV05_03150 [Candidatus Woesearchaeota archaeon]|nr:hypothetical protein [Candidatus Woesearchaeota archaeon]
MFKNKKGINFMTLLMFLLLPFLVFLLFSLQKQIVNQHHTIGDLQGAIIRTIDESAKTQSYIERSANQALSDSLYLLSVTNANPDISCGEYLGFALKNNEVNNCFFDEKELLIDLVKQKMIVYLEEISLELNYDYEIIQEGDYLVIRGISDNYYVPIYVDKESEVVRADSSGSREINVALPDASEMIMSP